ncbi:MAG: hypothetical protein H7Y31_13030 [Chitinophagaceae bacterium]|nr:hypothetical protein [Chitinophagaceae bacterium]
MQTAINNIVTQLFHQPTLNDVTIDQLTSYVEKYPYASIGRLLLAKKNKELGSDYTNDAENAALYINNPLWLHCFLTQDGIKHSGSIRQGVPAIVEQPSIIIHPVEEKPVEAHAPPILAEPEIVAPPVVAEPADHQPAVVEDGAPVFEPFYTIDYFASQGIRLKAEDLNKDKFGRQLKSFTDWLRSMKKLAPVEVVSRTETVEPDPEIQQTAEQSIAANDVETEAMAEVWIKQGKTGQAVEIYQKLSLQNPAKSDYFAAKIDQLKV